MHTHKHTKEDVMRASLQPSCSLPARYVTTPFRQKERAALGALRFAPAGGWRRRPWRSLECRAVETCEEIKKPMDSTASSFTITRRVEEVILPVPSDHPALHRLSKIDQLFSLHESAPILMFFTATTGGGISVDQTVRSLKRSLSQALSVFYPMAGRLVQRPGSATCFDVSCLDQGALFSEAWADCSLFHFYPDFQPHPDFNLLTPLPFSYDPEALLYIQVTHFTCGGFCVCMQESHILSDGVSLFHFLKSWVEILNGKRDLTLYPHMDLSSLEEGYKLNNLLTPSSSQYDQNFFERSPVDFDSQKYTSKIFHFTPNFIATLRGDANKLCNPTSYECIVGYLWQNMTRVHQYSHDEKTKLAFPVDIRRRLRPCLPPGYFGNALLRGFVYAKVEDLVAKEGLSYATSLVRDATSTIKSDFIKLALDWLGKQKSPLSALFLAPSHKGIFANTWTRIPFGDMNFPWGKPYCFRTHLDPNRTGESLLILPSPLGKGHVDVLVSLQWEHMIKFQELII